MNISYRNDDDIVIAEIEGNLDTVSSPEAEASLSKAIDEGARKLLISFEKMEFISSSGLRILLGLAKRQSKGGGELHLSNMNATVKEVFTISGFDTIIQSSDTVDEALAALRT